MAKFLLFFHTLNFREAPENGLFSGFFKAGLKIYLTFGPRNFRKKNDAIRHRLNTFGPSYDFPAHIQHDEDCSDDQVAGFVGVPEELVRQLRDELKSE